MNILLVAGGSKKDWPQIDFSDYAFFVGVDRGGLLLLKEGQSLDLAVGDFDSLSQEERLLVEKKAKRSQTSQAEKDDTDTQLALEETLKLFPKASITIVGATGGRLDHFLANLWLPMEARFQPFIRQIVLKDEQNTISYYLPGEYTVKREADKKYLAYCCLTPVENLTLKDSKYLLDRQQVPVPTSYASNEFVGETAMFSFDSGVIAVIQSKD
ncbi:thiamine diphosphokinase [Candidatus Enterococcus clewellii]|uniref:Thiamine diphosphokinase n=1 Tax=Candidatus Enterococcus clewellii TaxID=1834193 RepID=A0A242K9V2_9ENTE|nr:thiamine diphosphokinase [Enterococcus sp. 9E7_DIV0242]OTP17330.1 thiamine pyrophosphokinase [Enterococcus sp. 9E7_DIV0242]